MLSWIKRFFGINSDQNENDETAEKAGLIQDEKFPLYRIRCPQCGEFHFVKTPGKYSCPKSENAKTFEARQNDSDDTLTGYILGKMMISDAYQNEVNSSSSIANCTDKPTGIDDRDSMSFFTVPDTTSQQGCIEYSACSDQSYSCSSGSDNSFSSTDSGSFGN